MNILFIEHFFVGFMVYKIPIVSIFEQCPYLVTFQYCILLFNLYLLINMYIIDWNHESSFYINDTHTT